MGNGIRRFAAVLSVLLITLAAVPVFAKEANAAASEIEVRVDGKRVLFDVPPQLVQNRTFVPLRAVLEAIGAKVWWDQSAQTGYAEKDGVTIRMPLGSYQIYRNEQAIEMDVPIQIVNNRLLIPLRFVSQALGGVVDWRAASGTSPMLITIQSNVADLNRIGQPAEITVLNGSGKVLNQMMRQVSDLLQKGEISQKVSREYGFAYQKPVRIYLAADDEDYKQLLVHYNVADVQRTESIVQVSDGLTNGNIIFIPLNSYIMDGELSERYLTNALAHELTHVLSNQNGLFRMPIWMEEGLAWQIGLKLQNEGDPSVVADGNKTWMRNLILRTKQEGKLIGLINDQEESLTAIVKYNVELQDWMAMDFLLQQYGEDKLRNYLQLIRQETPEPFLNAFGTYQETFEKQFDASLTQSLQRADRGVKIQLRVSEEFQGEFSILPKAETAWRVYHLNPGEYTITVFPDGTIEGIQAERLEEESGPPETNVMHLELKPETNVSEAGKTIQIAGFILYYEFGDYFLLNGWKKYGDQSVDYSKTNQMAGVEILSVESL
jgi:hypothetical protein